MTSNAMRASLAAAALMAATLSAQAADRPVYKAMPPMSAPVAAPVPAWTGFYVGFNAGGAWGSSNWDAPPALDISTTGALYGLTAGYNVQVASWVFGVEGDYDWTKISGSTTCGTATCSTTNSWLSTFRGRIGYAVDRVMPYFTGGLAWGDIEASNNNAGFGTASSNRTGWTVGGGLEFLLGNNLTAKVEYLYVDLGGFDCGLACNAAPPDNVNLKTNIFRAGLNYKIDTLGGRY